MTLYKYRIIIIIIVIVFPANHLANVLKNQTKWHRKMHNSIQLNKPKQLNTINTS